MSAPLTTPGRCKTGSRTLKAATLLEDPDGPYADSPKGWWTECGGALDVRSGVVYIPRNPQARNLPRREYPEDAESS
ncbi:MULTISPECIES: hypothetical protein [unclassified Streptomyces]|uniref:hypothetical protein n=1 Tax=unclassified Streptomyces TaxID=2593676 RepID=UPI0034036327